MRIPSIVQNCMARGKSPDDGGEHDARFAEMEEGLDSIRDKQKTVKKSKAAKLKRKVANTGIVYMSRVPPHMKPNMLRQKLEAHGKVGKIYMVPTQTDPKDLKAELKARKTQYMKRSREFSEAWIEFEDKEEAEGIAQMLNCQPMGGKKRSRHSEDLWNLKFVPDMKWDDLMSEFSTVLTTVCLCNQHVAQPDLVQPVRQQLGSFLPQEICRKSYGCPLSRCQTHLVFYDCATHLPSHVCDGSLLAVHSVCTKPARCLQRTRRR